TLAALISTSSARVEVSVNRHASKENTCSSVFMGRLTFLRSSNGGSVYNLAVDDHAKRPAAQIERRSIPDDQIGRSADGKTACIFGQPRHLRSGRCQAPPRRLARHVGVDSQGCRDAHLLG